MGRSSTRRTAFDAIDRAVQKTVTGWRMVGGRNTPSPTRFASMPPLAKEAALRSGYGPIAQWLEPTAHNGLVPGSSPGGPTNFLIRWCQRRRRLCLSGDGRSWAPLRLRTKVRIAHRRRISSDEASVGSCVHRLPRRGWVSAGNCRHPLSFPGVGCRVSGAQPPVWSRCMAATFIEPHR